MSYSVPKKKKKKHQKQPKKHIFVEKCERYLYCLVENSTLAGGMIHCVNSKTVKS